MTWDGLNEQDRNLDRHISEDMLMDYSTWVLGEVTDEPTVDIEAVVELA